MPRPILIVDPFARIWANSVLYQKLALSMSKIGYAPTIVRCNLAFSHFCLSMEYRGLKPSNSEIERINVCSECVKNQLLIDSKQNYKVRFIEKKTYINTDFNFDNLSITNPYVASHKRKNEYIALYETLIKFKKVNLEFNKEQMEYYKFQLRSVITSRESAQEILDEIDPIFIICISPQYSVSGAFAAAAYDRNIPVFFAEGSSSPVNKQNTIRIWDWERNGLVDPAMQFWERNSNVPISFSSIFKAHQHFRTIFKKQSYMVFSPKKIGKIPKFLDPKKETILAVVSSSDETYSAYAIGRYPESKYLSKVYKNQLVWIESLITFVSKRNNTNLVIRVHPRDFTDTRNLLKSDSSHEWDKLLNKTPSNVFVDHPDDGISLYDYLKHVDVVTTGWSSVAIEAAYLGLPVITYDKNLPSFPSDIQFSGETEAAYYENLINYKHLHNKWIQKRKALRWIAYRDFESTYNLGGTLVQHYDLFGEFNLKRVIRRLIRIKPQFFKKMDAELQPKRKGIGRLRLFFETTLP